MIEYIVQDELLEVHSSIVLYIPGTVNPGRSGQLPSPAGSPPIRTHSDNEGVFPSKTKSWNHPGGAIWEFGGAVMVQVDPEQVNSGKSVR